MYCANPTAPPRHRPGLLTIGVDHPGGGLLTVSIRLGNGVHSPVAVRGLSVEWIIGIACSIVGAILWALASAVYFQLRERRGALAGCWFQVTYDPDPHHRNDVWSIEWVEARHHRDRVTGRMYRIYPGFYDRRWEFKLWGKGDVFRGPYFCVNGSGGDGLLTLKRKRNVLCVGAFTEDDAERPVITEAKDGFAAPLEWLRVDCDLAADIREHLASFFAKNPAAIDKAVRKQLYACLRGHTTITYLLEQLGNGAGLSDMSTPLALERYRRKIDSEALARWHPGGLVHIRENGTLATAEPSPTIPDDHQSGRHPSQNPEASEQATRPSEPGPTDSPSNTADGL